MQKRGKHQTVHRDARKAIDWLDAQPEAKKVLLGLFRPGTCTGGGHRHQGAVALRAVLPAGVQVQVMTGDGILDVVVTMQSHERDGFIDRIARRWPRYADRAADPRRRLRAA